jgi:MHS family proline/betaine transporter-like MFS transporter
MAIPTAAIGILPPYASIGIAAPILLTLIRLIQGFSLGGEFSGCIAYIVEHSPPRTRGVAGSASFVSMCMGMLLGSATAYFLTYVMSQEDLVAFGWRLPFIAGLFIGLIGLYIRTHLSESPIYKAAKASQNLSTRPLYEVMTQHLSQLFLAIAIYITVTAPFYTVTVFIESFMQKLGYTAHEASIASACILITMIVILPLSAWLSDIVGRRPILILGATFLALCTYPIFWILGQMNFVSAVISQMIFAAIVAFYMGPVPTVLVELFPTRVRFTGVALAYNLSAAVFGGTAPMVGMMLVKLTGDQYAIAYYLSGLALFTLFALRSFNETYRCSLEEQVV